MSEPSAPWRPLSLQEVHNNKMGEEQRTNKKRKKKKKLTKQEIHQSARHRDDRGDEVLNGGEGGFEDMEDRGEDALEGGKKGGEERAEGVDYACHYYFFWLPC